MKKLVILMFAASMSLAACSKKQAAPTTPQPMSGDSKVEEKKAEPEGGAPAEGGKEGGDAGKTEGGMGGGADPCSGQ